MPGRRLLYKFDKGEMMPWSGSTRADPSEGLFGAYEWWSPHSANAIMTPLFHFCGINTTFRRGEIQDNRETKQIG